MKIALAQTNPVKGDIAANLATHTKWIGIAASKGAELIVFPELSITGYEPTLAKDLACELADGRFDELQVLSDKEQIMIAAGMPVNNVEGLTISLLLFTPQQPREVYSKQHLHADEEPFFINGTPHAVAMEDKHQIGFAICYEISMPEHAAMAHTRGARTYIASVAKSVKGMPKAMDELAATAQKYAMPVLMVNCVGHCDDFDCGGLSGAWNSKGELIGQLNETDEGLLIIDNKTQGLVAKMQVTEPLT